MRHIALWCFGACSVGLGIVSSASCTDVVHLTLDTPSPPAATPNAPSGVVGTAGISTWTVSWSPNASTENVLSYRVYAAEQPWTAWSETLPFAMHATDLSCCVFTDSGATNDVDYLVRITALNSNGESALSASSLVRPPRWIGARQVGTTTNDVVYSLDAFDGRLVVAGFTDGSFSGYVNQGSRDAYLLVFRANGDLAEVKQFGTTALDNAFGVRFDSSGNFFVTGNTQGALEGTNQGSSDTYVAKYLADGTREWIRQFGSTLSDSPSGRLAVFGTNAIFVAGQTTGVLDGSNAGMADMFVARFDAGGNRLWTRQLGTTGTEVSAGVAADVDGIYVAGTTAGSIDGNVTAGGTDMFVTHYDPSGGKVWTQQLGTSADETAYGIVTDGQGSLFIVGVTNGGLDGNASNGGADIFVARYSTSGTKQWVKQFGTSGSDAARAVDYSGGALFVGGDTSGALHGQPAVGLNDCFVLRLDDAGAVVWTRIGGSTAGDSCDGLAAYNSGRAVFVGGHTAGQVVQPVSGIGDAFVLKFNGAGEAH